MKYYFIFGMGMGIHTFAVWPKGSRKCTVATSGCFFSFSDSGFGSQCIGDNYLEMRPVATSVSVPAKGKTSKEE